MGNAIDVMLTYVQYGSLSLFVDLLLLRAKLSPLRYRCHFTLVVAIPFLENLETRISQGIVRWSRKVQVKQESVGKS